MPKDTAVEKNTYLVDRGSTVYLLPEFLPTFPKVANSTNGLKQNWGINIPPSKKNPGLATRRLSGESRINRNAPDNYNIAEHRFLVNNPFYRCLQYCSMVNVPVTRQNRVILSSWSSTPKTALKSSRGIKVYNAFPSVIILQR
jgi:hypothetical protein